jgi:hypothetical protein
MNRSGRKSSLNKKKSNESSVTEKPLLASTSDSARNEETVGLVPKRNLPSEPEGPLPGKRECGVKTTNRRPLKRKCPSNKKKSNASPARKKPLPACTSDTAQEKEQVKEVRERKVRSESQGPVSGKKKGGAKTKRKKSLKRKCPRKKK